jgi:hypothetical protein
MRARRDIAGAGGWALAALVGLGVWWGTARAREPAAVRMSFVTRPLTWPTGGALLSAQDGTFLTRVVRRPLLLAVPSRMPGWARVALRRLAGRRLGPGPELLELTGSQWRSLNTWAAPGLMRVTVPMVEPRDRMLAPEVRVLEAPFGHAAAAVRVFIPLHGPVRFAVRAPAFHAVATTLRAGWMIRLSRVLPDNATLVVVDPRGHLLALASALRRPGLLLAASPSAGTLLPPLLALAVQQPGLFRGPVPSTVGQEAGWLARRWGWAGIARAYRRLGLGMPTWPGAPVVPLPRTGGTDLAGLLGGRGVWISALALARAWLPFVDHGREPPLSELPGRQPAFGPLPPPVMTPQGRRVVWRVLPRIQAGTWQVVSWAPNGGHAAVAVFRSGATVRLVAVTGLRGVGAWLAILVSLAKIMG